MRRAAWGSVFLLRSAFLNPRLAFTAGILIFETLHLILFLFSPGAGSPFYASAGLLSKVYSGRTGSPGLFYLVPWEIFVV